MSRNDGRAIELDLVLAEPVRPAASGADSRPAPRRADPAPRARRRLQLQGYSGFVALAKFTLPVVALALVALVWAWPHIEGRNLGFRLGFSGVAAREAADPSMVNARYMGADKDEQPYSVTAEVARAVTPDKMQVELELPKGDIMLKDGTWLVLTADTGLYARDSKSLTLNGKVTLFHDTGYELRTERAVADLTQGSAAGDRPVRGQGPFGDLESQGFRLIDKGEVILFTGKAKLVLYPGVRKPTS